MQGLPDTGKRLVSLLACSVICVCGRSKGENFKMLSNTSRFLMLCGSFKSTLLPQPEVAFIRQGEYVCWVKPWVCSAPWSHPCIYPPPLRYKLPDRLSVRGFFFFFFLPLCRIILLQDIVIPMQLLNDKVKFQSYVINMLLVYIKSPDGFGISFCFDW